VGPTPSARSGLGSKPGAPRQACEPAGFSGGGDLLRDGVSRTGAAQGARDGDAPGLEGGS